MSTANKINQKKGGSLHFKIANNKMNNKIELWQN